MTSTTRRTRDEIIPVTALRIGDQVVGGTVTAIRTSQSGKTTYITTSSVVRPGHIFEYGQSTTTRIMVFSDAE